MRAVCIGVMLYYQRRPLYSTGVLRVFPGAGRWSGLAGRVVPPVLSDPVKGRGPGHDRHCFMLFYIVLSLYRFCAAAPSLSFKLAACAASTGRRGVSIRHRGGPSRGRIAMRSHGSPQYYHRFIARGNGAVSTVVSRPPSSVSPCPCRRRIGRPNVPAVRPVSLPELSLVAIPPLPS